MRNAALLALTLMTIACAAPRAVEPPPNPAPQPPATFTPSYQAAHRGEFAVVVPEVYELVNIAIALTDYVQGRPGTVSTNNEYYARVAAHFGRFRDHAFVRDIDRQMQAEPIISYIYIKLNGYAFEFDDDGQIVRSAIFDRIQDDRANVLAPLLAEMQSFADQSDFRAFYAANHNFYESQIRFIRDDLDMRGMSRWLEQRFPDVRPYDGVNVILSPLAGSVQNLASFESNGYRELQPHINFPYNSNPNLSSEGNAVWRGTLLFGEMNHGFINPTSDRYRAEIDAALRRRGAWTNSTNADTYSDDLALFDEYMNFGLITLYHHDRMSAADARVAQARIDTVMVEGRGFMKFAEFDAFLVDLYEHRTPDQTIADLYPQLIAWFAAQPQEE